MPSALHCFGTKSASPGFPREENFMPQPSTGKAAGQGIVRDDRGQDQPKDKARAQQTAGLKSQKEAAETQPQSPGEPAGGE
jgi:hypothetical protein